MTTSSEPSPTVPPTPTPKPAPTTSLGLHEEPPGLPADDAALAKFKAAGIDETGLVAGTRRCQVAADYLINPAGTARIITMYANENEGQYETKGWIALGYKGSTITSATYFPWKPGSGNGGLLACGQTPTTVCVYQAGRLSGYKLEALRVGSDGSMTKVKAPIAKGSDSSALISAKGGVAFVDGVQINSKTVRWKARIITGNGLTSGGCLRKTGDSRFFPPKTLERFSAIAC